MKTSQVLEKALKMLGPHGRNWGQGMNYTRVNGVPKFCAWGAIRRATKLRCWDTLVFLGEHGIVGRSYERDAITFNDKPGRKFAQIKNAFQRAIKAAKKQEAKAAA